MIVDMPSPDLFRTSSSPSSRATVPGTACGPGYRLDSATGTHRSSDRVYVDHSSDPILDFKMFQDNSADESPNHYDNLPTSRRVSSTGVGDAACAAKPNKVPTPFPQLVYTMLKEASEKGFDDIVSWRPHGRAFLISDRERFEQEVLPKYFLTNRYASFARQISVYQLFRIDRGPDQGCWFHEYLLRGRPDLISNLCRYVPGSNGVGNEVKRPKGRSSTRTWAVNLYVYPFCHELAPKNITALKKVPFHTTDQSGSRDFRNVGSLNESALVAMSSSSLEQQLQQQKIAAVNDNNAKIMWMHQQATAEALLLRSVRPNDSSQTRENPSPVSLFSISAWNQAHQHPSSMLRLQQDMTFPSNIREGDGMETCFDSEPIGTVDVSNDDDESIDLVAFEELFALDSVHSPSLPMGAANESNNHQLSPRQFAFPNRVSQVGDLDTLRGTYHLPPVVLKQPDFTSLR